MEPTSLLDRAGRPRRPRPRPPFTRAFRLATRDCDIRRTRGGDMCPENSISWDTFRAACQPRTTRFAGTLQSPLTDSNRRPLPYHGSALPAELRGRLQGLPGFAASAALFLAALGLQNLGRPLLQASVADVRAP